MFSFPTLRGLRWPIVAGLTAAAALLLVASCSSEGASAEPVSAAGTWGEQGQGRPQLVLGEDGSLSGTDGCNRLVGSWTQDGENVSFGQVGSTMMACPDVEVWLVDPNSGRVDRDTLHVFDSAGTEIGTLDRVSD